MPWKLRVIQVCNLTLDDITKVHLVTHSPGQIQELMRHMHACKPSRFESCKGINKIQETVCKVGDFTALTAQFWYSRPHKSWYSFRGGLSNIFQSYDVFAQWWMHCLLNPAAIWLFVWLTKQTFKLFNRSYIYWSFSISILEEHSNFYVANKLREIVGGPPEKLLMSHITLVACPSVWLVVVTFLWSKAIILQQNFSYMNNKR